ncbi:hypothetical protein WS70_23545 [Burkholderia mayonis]|uniref:Uncharacterized protein n=1 Tax=Burkholderia mayonis TaxID=1385591 RepID=A0A1B4FM56_9BURK|nr:YjbH domain-containing protein [Burkholderia mayonis]AOJ04744.1 hypothetical protein WS70_23545 [Burkholderia mayonis]KVE41282.1 hypothetical protein WS70_14770 [Burkholderia mayonis]
MLLALAATHAKFALSSEPAMSFLGQTGGLVIPYGTTLPTGEAEFQFNDYKDPRFATQASSAQSYFGAFGFLPYVEISGGLVNYAKPQPSVIPGQESFVIRHLLGNVKLGVPHVFEGQPDIAIGATDFGGQTKFFRSKYVVVTDSFGPVRVTFGAGWGGQRLNGVFGGAELMLGRSGLSVLAEHDSSVAYAGVRYRSPAIAWLGDARLIGTVQHSLSARQSALPVGRTAVSLGLQIPLGRRYDDPLALVTPDRSGGSPEAAALTPEPRFLDRPGSSAAPRIEPRAAIDVAGERHAPSVARDGIVPERCSATTVDQGADRLLTIRDLLIRLGLERVKLGRYRRYLIVEYENHRYNQNEADALGIVFGVAARVAPCDVIRVVAVIKKAGMAVGQVSVDRQSFAAFIVGGHDDRDAGDTLLMSTRPTFSDADVSWASIEPGPRSLARIEIAPKTSYLIGTEYGKFDYSLAANIEGFVPLWKGAELYASYVAPIRNSANVGSGRVFDEFALETGLSDVTLNQILWANAQTLNVAGIGKIGFHYFGIEDEMTFFVPSRPDIVRLRLAYLKRFHGASSSAVRRNVENAVLLYRWVQPSWHLWVEAGVARYVGGDRGPLLNIVRWFDDVAVGLSVSHSEGGTFAGVSISFPLTPRQGMSPGVIEVTGAETVPLSVRTRVGSAANTVSSGAAEDLSFGYSTQQFLLNQGRFSEAYFQSQLFRMRDAWRRFALPVMEGTK